MRRQLYKALRRTLTQERRSRIKRQVAHARKRLAPLYRARYGTFGAAELMAELERHVPADTEIIMVHCSVNDLEPVYTGTVRELLDGLLALCGTERTLAMPAFFFGGRSGDPAAHYAAKPVFDARRQPSEMGMLAEAFRRHRGVRRSLHPTASVCALGPLAEELTATHHLAAGTFGPGSPFAVMAERRTVVLGIGTEYWRSLSQTHAPEDLLGDRFPLRVRPTTLPVEVRDAEGRTHHYDLPITDSSITRRTELLELIMRPDELVRWRFHGVPLYAVSAARVTEVMIEAALRGETIYAPMPIRAPA